MVAVMDCETKGSEERFKAYVEALAEVIGHADRKQPLRDYCLGLLMPCERKSVEPMAAGGSLARLCRASVASALRGPGALVG